MEPISFSVGADPEFFLFKDGEPVSAHNLVPGNKYDPFPVDCGAIQADGTAVEFNIIPAKSSSEFVRHISTVLERLRDIIPPEYEFRFTPSVEYPKDYFRRIPVSARRLGCDPDFDAYQEGRMNVIPRRPGSLRTGAGHIHVGWGHDFSVGDPEHLWSCMEAVKQLDNTIGNVEPSWCDDTRRRSLYGKKGAFRPKPYGVEYRVLSNSWLAYPKLWPWLFDAAVYSMEELADGDLLDYYGTPEFGQYKYAAGCFPPGFPQFPTDITMEKEPWLSRF